MVIPLITEIQRFSLQDGPGIRTTIFVKGCPLHCPWCHNPETQSPKPQFYFFVDRCTVCGRCIEVCPSGASTLVSGRKQPDSVAIDRAKCISCMKCVEACLSGAREIVGQELGMDTIVQEAVADKPFFQNSGGGVTISGGDPLLFRDFTLELTRILKTDEKIHVAMETSCFARWENIEPLLPYIDLVVVDIKMMDAEQHKKVIGGSLSTILSNIEKLTHSNASIRIHLPIIPGFNDNSEHETSCVEFLGQFSNKLAGVDILPYHVYGAGKYARLGRHYQLDGIENLPAKQIIPLAKALKRTGIKEVTVGGLVGMTQKETNSIHQRQSASYESMWTRGLKG